MKNEYKPKVEKIIVKPKEDLIVVGESKGYITVSKDKSRITYNATGKSYSFKDPEEAIRAQVYIELIERYKYPADRINTEIEPPRREPKLPADIVVYEKIGNKCFIVVEAKEEETEKKIEEAKREGLGNATLLDAQYLLLACGSLRLAYDIYEKPPLEQLEKHRIADIPVAYGKEPEFKYKKGDAQWDLEAANFNELQHKFQLCHNEIWEGGKRDPAIAFDEMSKLMFTKIFDERSTKNEEYYRFQIGTHEEQRNVVRRIKEIYAEVQDKEPDVFKGEIELRDRLVFRLVEILQDLSFSRTDLDIKGRAFEKFLGMLFRGEFGQFFTRREIVEFMVDMLSPTKDDICLDPACGSGGFILYAMDRVRRKAEVDYAGDKRAIDEIYYYFPRDNIFGIEINDRIARIAMMDMVIHEDGHTNIENNDSLADPKIFNPKRDIRLGKYTFLLTNPPFGAKIKDEEVLKQYELGSKQKNRKSQRSEILFIERCLDFLKPGGRMGIVLPDGILTNSSLQYVRRFIERKAIILAVISMPQTAFVPVGAGVKASLLFLQKKRFDGEDIGNYPIFMSIAEHIGYDATSKPDKNELPEILREYKQFLQGKREFNPAFVVYKEQLEVRFDPYYYQPRFIDVPVILGKSLYPLVPLEKLATLITDGTHKTPRYVEAGIPFLSAKNIFEDNIDFENIKFISVEEHSLLSECQPLPGDLVLSKSGTIGVSQVVPFDSPEFSVFESVAIIRLKGGYNPKYIQVFLNSKLGQNQIERATKGAVIRHLHLENLKEIKIPLPPHEIQDNIANIMGKVYKERKEKLAKAKELLDSIELYLLEQLAIKLSKAEKRRSFVVNLDWVRGERFDSYYHQPLYVELEKAIENSKFKVEKLGSIASFSSQQIEPLTNPERVYKYIEIEHIDSELGKIKGYQEIQGKSAPSRARMLLRSEDLLISSLQGSSKSIATVPRELDGAIGSTGFIIIRQNGKLNNTFIWALFRTSIYQRLIFREATGAIMCAVLQSRLAQIKIPLPPSPIQISIAQETERRRKEAEQLRSQADKIVEEAKRKVEQMILGTKY